MTNYLLWILAAAILGFAIAAIFAGWLRLKRDIYLLAYIPISLAFVAIFFIFNKINIKELLLHNWYWGLLGTVVAGAFVIKNVLSQPASPRRKGAALICDIVWPGFFYGLTDSLLLSVLPILAVQLAVKDAGWAGSTMNLIGSGALALLASLFVTTLYHWGYPEFRGKKVIFPIIGNGILSLAMLLTINPLAAILPHIAMHIAAMVHGRETTGQVPPHYNS
jgi:hypothetical protein